MPITIFVCEPQPVTVEGLRRAMEGCADFQFAGAAGLEKALPVLSRLQPDVVLLSEQPDFGNTLEFATRVRDAAPNCKVILWAADTAFLDQAQVFQAGVWAVASKELPAEQLLECLRTTGSGGIWVDPVLQPSRGQFQPRLTAREKEVVRLICRGKKNREIAESLSIAPGTVKAHLMHVFEKTGARSRYDVAVAGRQWLGTGAAASQRQAQTGLPE